MFAPHACSHAAGARQTASRVHRRQEQLADECERRLVRVHARMIVSVRCGVDQAGCLWYVYTRSGFDICNLSSLT